MIIDRKILSVGQRLQNNYSKSIIEIITVDEKCLIKYISTGYLKNGIEIGFMITYQLANFEWTKLSNQDKPICLIK